MTTLTAGPRPSAPDRYDLFSLGLLAGAALITAALYERLPAEVPVHFDLHARPDGWMPRPAGASILLVIAALAGALTRFGARVLPGGWRERLAASPTSAVTLLLVALLVALHVCVLHAALHPTATLAAFLYVPLGLFFVLLAQVLPRVRRNPFIGVRTTWSLTSDENWARTHRVAGWSMTAGGAAAALAGLGSAPVLALAAIVVSTVVPAIYSFVLARRQQR